MLVQQQQQQQQHASVSLPVTPHSKHHTEQQPRLPQQLCEQRGLRSAWCAGAAQQVHDIAAWALQRLAAQQHLCTARELACILWCCAKLQHRPPAGMLAQLLARFSDVAHTGSCQAVSMVLYALVLLQHVPDEGLLHHLLHSFVKAAGTARGSAQRGGQGAAAGDQQPGLQTRDFTCGQDSVPHHQWQQQQQQHEWQQQRQQHQQQRRQQHPACNVQASSNTIWALVQLQQPRVAFAWLLPLLSVLLCSITATTAVLLKTQQQLHQQQQQDYHHHSLQTTSPLRAAAACVQAASASSVMQAGANALWACAVLLQRECVDEGGNAAGQACAAADSTPRLVQQPKQKQQLQLQLLPAIRQAAGELLNACAGCLPAAQPRELVMVLWACSKLRLQPSSAVQSQLWGAAGAVARLTGSEAAAVLHALARLRLCPPPAWLAALLAGSQRQLGSLSGVQLSVMIWACGTLRCRPPPAWMHAALAQLLGQLQGSQPLPPACLSMAVWGLSKLGFKPAAPAAHALMQAATALSQQLR
jgi:hypothetical protein